MEKGFVLILAVAFFGSAVVRAADEGSTTRPTLESVQKENRKLREENDQLRRRIAKLMATTRASATQPVVKVTTTKPAVVEVEVTADVDGTDEVRMSRGGLTWKHNEWDWPSNVTVNGKLWDPHEVMKWGDLGLEATDSLAVGRVVDRSGRGTVKLEPDDEGPVIYFSDPDPGADTYTIKFTLIGLRQREAKSK